MGSATSSCLSNVGKLGATRVMEKIRSRDPRETCIILNATTVERKDTMLVTVSDPLR